MQSAVLGNQPLQSGSGQAIPGVEPERSVSEADLVRNEGLDVEDVYQSLDDEQRTIWNRSAQVVKAI